MEPIKPEVVITPRACYIRMKFKQLFSCFRDPPHVEIKSAKKFSTTSLESRMTATKHTGSNHMSAYITLRNETQTVILIYL